MPNLLSAALYQKGRWEQRSQDVTWLINGERRSDIATMVLRRQEQWTRYVLAGHDQSERDRRTKKSPAFEELAVRAATRADEMLVFVQKRAEEELASAQEGATSFNDYKSRQKKNAKQRRNYFHDETDQRWTMSELVQELVRKPDLRQSATSELWVVLVSRLKEMELDPLESEDPRNRADEEVQHWVRVKKLSRPFILYGEKPQISPRRSRTSKRLNGSEGSSSAAEIDCVRRFHVTYRHFFSLVAEARRAMALRSGS